MKGAPGPQHLGVAWELSGPSLEATEELPVCVIMHKIVQLIALLTCPHAWLYEISFILDLQSRCKRCN